MDAHLLRTGVLLAAFFSLGAGHAPQGHIVMSPSARSCRSQNFVITASSPQFAQQLCRAAEQYRHDLALEWLGRELPPWRDICPIQVTVGRMGAGGATSFVFVNGEPRDWRMSIQGSPERVLDSVLPHEITHMIMATHLGRPLPRWADEGAATTVEHASERSKQHTMLLRFLSSQRGIPFNHMFAMKDYPPDIMPLYSQGYSLARFLIAQGGKQKFVQYVGDGMDQENWTAATREHYGYDSLSELQVKWVSWIKHGSPQQLAVAHLPAKRHAIPPVAGTRTQTVPTTNLADSVLVPLPTRAEPNPQYAAAPSSRAILRPSPSSLKDGWYSRQRNQVVDRLAEPEKKRSGTPKPHELGRPQPLQQPGQIILDAKRNPNAAATGTVLR